MSASESTAASLASCSLLGQERPGQPAEAFLLDDLPNRAVELIAQYASTPTTPATCLLPMVCRGWQAAADRVQPLVDIRLDLAPVYQAPHAAAATALLKGGQLAGWLTKHRRRVRSLCLLPVKASQQMAPRWEQDLSDVRDTITASQWIWGPGAGLPHLVQLELPVMGLPGTSAFLQALARCPSLQQLTLGRRSRGYGMQTNDIATLSRALSPLTQLRALHMEYPGIDDVKPEVMAGLLRALPPSLEDMQLEDVHCMDSIPLSCMTHLINLRAWDTPVVRKVADDSRSSSSGSGGSSRSSASAAHGVAAMTALTRLSFQHVTLEDQDARLKLPNLRALQLRDAEPEAWQQLQAMKQLQQVTVLYLYGAASSNSNAEGLGGMTQLQELQLRLGDWHIALRPPLMEPWAAAIGRLTGLTSLRLSALLVVGCEPIMLAPLTQMRELTIDFQQPLAAQHFLRGAHLAADPASAVVSMLASYKTVGLKLQRLGLIVPSAETYWQRGVQDLAAGAKVVWPGVEVEVQWYHGGRLL